MFGPSLPMFGPAEVCADLDLGLAATRTETLNVLQQLQIPL